MLKERLILPPHTLYSRNVIKLNSPNFGQVALTLVQYELDHGRSDQSQFDKSVIMAIDQFEDTELNCRVCSHPPSFSLFCQYC